jgi:hypothetical protein
MDRILSSRNWTSSLPALVNKYRKKEHISGKSNTGTVSTRAARINRRSIFQSAVKPDTNTNSIKNKAMNIDISRIKEAGAVSRTQVVTGLRWFWFWGFIFLYVSI